jgi:signal transduction histidine kinase
MKPLPMTQSQGITLAPSSWTRFVREVLLYSDTPADVQAAFDRNADATTARLASGFFFVIFSAVVLWWPLDFVLYAEQPQTLRAMFDFRLGMMIVSVLVCGVAYLPARLQRFAIPWTAVCGVGASFLATWSCGRAAPLSPEWFGIAYVFPITTVGFLISLPRRIVMALLFGVAAWTGYFVGNPAHLAQERYVGATVSFMMVTVVSGVAIGHLAYHYLRAGFIAQRALASIKDELEDRVRAQTSDLRQITGRLDQLRERERTEIARDLAAGPGEELSAIEFETGLMEESASRRGVALEVTQVRRLMERMRETFGRRVGALQPRALAAGNLAEAIRALVEEQRQNGGLDIQLTVEPATIEAGDELAPSLFRIVQEALTNVVRHAQARTVEVTLRRDADGLSASVRDDGVGIGDRSGWRRESVGIIGMHERAQRVGGTLLIERDPSGGTRVSVRVPTGRATA